MLADLLILNEEKFDEMKRLFVLVCGLGLWAAAWAAPEVNIVPKPLNVETGDGSFTVDAATVVTVGRDASLRLVGGTSTPR